MSTSLGAFLAVGEPLGALLRSKAAFFTAAPVSALAEPAGAIIGLAAAGIAPRARSR
jgi:hypothetical protein